MSSYALNIGTESGSDGEDSISDISLDTCFRFERGGGTGDGDGAHDALIIRPGAIITAGGQGGEHDKRESGRRRSHGGFLRRG